MIQAWPGDVRPSSCRKTQYQKQTNGLVYLRCVSLLVCGGFLNLRHGVMFCFFLLGFSALFSGWAFHWQGGDTMCFSVVFCLFFVFVVVVVVVAVVVVVVVAVPGIRLGLWESFEIDKHNLTHPV